MALVLVGAILVSGIETVWHGEVTPPSIANLQSWTYAENAPVLNKGEEMGRFNMGSTIIVLFGKDKMQWQAGFQANSPIKVGEKIGLIAI
jgi:phosphatidylserine decarboxylase